MRESIVYRAEGESATERVRAAQFCRERPLWRSIPNVMRGTPRRAFPTVKQSLTVLGGERLPKITDGSDKQEASIAES
jgi:hypothetical protein